MKPIVVLWLAVLGFVVTVASVSAQRAFRFTPVDPPIVLSGSDLGFQITAREGVTPVGNLVVRIDGRWVPVKEAGGPALLSSR